MALRFLYRTPPGRVLLKLLVVKPVSRCAGRILNSRPTRVFIRGFVKRNKINMAEYPRVKYRSFNDFFTREVNMDYRPFPENDCDVAAPCDGKLTAYPITASGVFNIKNSVYTISDLLEDKELASDFIDGVCMIFRLTPDDYHRYYYIDDGEILAQKRIKGKLHAVRPIAQRRYNVFSRNAREYTVMQTRNFGKVVQMEVGALFVGRISNNDSVQSFKRGDEKGMFQFGGSTVIMLFQKGAITPDNKIFENTLNDKETIVRMGYIVGEKAKG